MRDLVPEILNERANRGFALRFWPDSLIAWMRRQPGWDVQATREFGEKFAPAPVGRHGEQSKGRSSIASRPWFP
jgi:hypothetical protein